MFCLTVSECRNDRNCVALFGVLALFYDRICDSGISKVLLVNSLCRSFKSASESLMNGTVPSHANLLPFREGGEAFVKLPDPLGLPCHA